MYKLNTSMKYFTLQECTYSATAEAKGIDNTPTPEIEAHIMESVEMLLDPLREAWQQRRRRRFFRLSRALRAVTHSGGCFKKF